MSQIRKTLTFEMNRLGDDVEDDDEYFMPMTLRLVGYLLMPVFPEANDDVPNVNPTVLLAQAASNLAAKIYSGAQGWNCGVARIDAINFIDDSTEDKEGRDYHVAEIHWSHSHLGRVNPDKHSRPCRIRCSTDSH